MAVGSETSLGLEKKGGQWGDRKEEASARVLAEQVAKGWPAAGQSWLNEGALLIPRLLSSLGAHSEMEEKTRKTSFVT